MENEENVVNEEVEVKEETISLAEYNELDDRFKRMLADDNDLRHEYKDWCEDMGYSERSGFSDYAEEYISNCEEKWDSLTDYDQ